MYLEMYSYVFEEKWKEGHFDTPVTLYTDAYIQDDKGAFEISFVPEDAATKGQWIKRAACLIVSRREAKELGEILLKLK